MKTDLFQSCLSNFTFTFHLHALEKEMATHSTVLACRIPGQSQGEPGGLLSMGSHRVGHDWSNLAAAAAVPALSQLSIFFLQIVSYFLTPRWHSPATPNNFGSLFHLLGCAQKIYATLNIYLSRITSEANSLGKQQINSNSKQLRHYNKCFTFIT